MPNNFLFHGPGQQHRNDHGYVPLDVYTSRSFHQSQVIIGFVIRLTRLVPLVEQELSVLSEHMSSPNHEVSLLITSRLF
jgi:hypothetical protein